MLKQEGTGRSGDYNDIDRLYAAPHGATSMEERLRGVSPTFAAVVGVVQDRNITFLAGSLAYYAFVSLIPLFLLVLVAASTVGSEAFADRMVALTQGFLTPDAQDALMGAVVDAPGAAGASAVGAIALVWSTLKIFRGIDVAFSQIYGTAGEKGFVGQIVDALLALTVIVVAIAAAVVASAAFVLLPDVPYLGLLNPLLLVVGLTAAFLPLYYLFPDVGLDLREALPGAAVAAVGWAALQALFQVYAANAGNYEAYGVVGGVLLLVTWLYFAGLLLLVGAVVNFVLADRTAPDEADAVAPAPEGVEAPESRVERDEFEPDTEREPLPAGRAGETDLREELRLLRGDVTDLAREVRASRGRGTRWGPYVALLFGTVMTVSAFYLLSGVWALLSMLVIWTATLGLVVVIVLIGVGWSLLDVPGRLRP